MSFVHGVAHINREKYIYLYIRKIKEIEEALVILNVFHRKAICECSEKTMSLLLAHT